MNNVLKKLKGGDRRSIGRVNEVVADVLNEPSLFGTLFSGLFTNDPVIRMRSADAIEKITAQNPDYLQPYKKRLLEQVAKIEQQEVRWHVAQMVPRLELSRQERASIVEILLGYLTDKSSIVKTFSIQALVDLADNDTDLRRRVIPLLDELMRTGSPAMKTRGRKLLERLYRH
ncbi:MAG: hypothetical protein JSW12_04030 [Deltaproteobacteria bacterium]|nr:MAG: hypothetical protein JSW12_04030 [Deltaproteobacteria bacterium]